MAYGFSDLFPGWSASCSGVCSSSFLSHYPSGPEFFPQSKPTWNPISEKTLVSIQTAYSCSNRTSKTKTKTQIQTAYIQTLEQKNERIYEYISKTLKPEPQLKSKLHLNSNKSLWRLQLCSQYTNPNLFPRSRWRRRMRSSSSGAIWPRLTEGRR